MTSIHSSVLADLAASGLLCCPHCGAPLEPVEAETGRLAGLRCAAGHVFDAARQGYVSFAVGRAMAHGDSAEMVAARERFLGGGHYEPIADAIGDLLGGHVQAGNERIDRAVAGDDLSGGGLGGGDLPAGPIVEVGAGTAYYLSRVLDRMAPRQGLALDVSPAALRRAARAHRRAGALGVDIWRPWPLADGAAAAIVCVFGPRNQDEFARVLAPGGLLVVATPGPDHLAELIGPLGMITVDPDKEDRLATQLSGFTQVAVRHVRFEMRLPRAATADVAAMGPSARHVEPAELAQRVSLLPTDVAVTADVRVAAYEARLSP